jgi:hypothetical protein
LAGKYETERLVGFLVYWRCLEDMPLLSYEGVEVELPADLVGIRFEFSAGTLKIRCQGFTGDVVLSKPAPEAAPSPSKKRTIDLSASDDDDEEESDPKRARPNFLNEVEQTLLLAQLNGSQRSEKPKGQTVKAEPESEEGKGEQPEESDPVTAKSSKKTPTKKASKKKTGSAKGAVDAFFSPDSKQATSRKAAPDSNKKRNRTPKSRAEPSPGKSIKDLIGGPPKPKPAGANTSLQRQTRDFEVFIPDFVPVLIRL